MNIFLTFFLIIFNIYHVTSHCRFGYDYYDCVEKKACNYNTNKCDCPSPPCRNFCHQGRQKNKDGCPTCDCAEKDLKEPYTGMCPRIQCGLECKNGYQNDSKGCEVCRCRVKPIPNHTINRPGSKCRPGYDFYDCPLGKSCQQVSKNCSCDQIRCRLDCKNGYKNGKDGCEICRCRSKNEKRKSVVPEGKCPGVRCNERCVYGYEKDDNNCDICFCSDKKLPTTPKAKDKKKCSTWQKIKNFFGKKIKC